MIRVSTLRRFRLVIAENGIFFTGMRIQQIFFRYVRSAIIGRRLRAKHLTIGRLSTLRGLKYISVGNNFTAGDGLWLEAISRYGDQSFQPQIIIGSGVNVSNWSHIAATNRIEIGDGVLIGSKVMITDHNHGTYAGNLPSSPMLAPGIRSLESSRTVVIGRNVWLADGVVVTPDTTIGEGTVVGANSVVTGKIPAFSIVVGSPAKVIKTYDFNRGAWITTE